jgi:hypothetical protein
MALITSAASGNFSAGATWTGGVVPGVGDEARASTGHTITIDVNTTCDEISNAGTGIFTLADGVTLTANVTNKSTTINRTILQFTAASPAVGDIIGNITGQNTINSSPVATVVNSSSGTLNITGTVSARGQQVLGCANTSSGIINITGNVNGGTGTNAYGANNTSTGTINITGNVGGGSSTTAHGANNNATGTISITGNVTAGSSTSTGANNNSTGTLSIIGTVTASQTAAGVAGANVQQVTILSGPFITETTRGVNPVYCAAWRWNASPSNSTYLEVMTNTLGAKRNLVTEDNVTGMPDEADVKDGIVYGPTSALTGTFEQTVAPSVSDIAAAVWDRVLTGATHNIPSSAGRRLRILDDERIITDGQVQGAGTNTVTLEPITTLCIGQTVVVTDQTTGNKQVRFILSFDSATNVATVDTQWCDIPNIGDEYQLTTVRSPLIARNDYPSGTIGAEIDEMYLIHGLKDGETLTVTPTSRTAGAIAQTIGGDGTTTTTVSRD